MAAECPRPFNQRERDLLELILGTGRPGFADLAAQLDHAEVLELCGAACSCVEDIRVPAECRPMPREYARFGRLLPVELEAFDGAGEQIGGILVWVRAGYLGAIEFHWWTEEPPPGLPELARVRLIGVEPD